MTGGTVLTVPAHGSLGLSTPWARQYLPPDQRPAVEAEIPTGHVLGVSARLRPGHWVLWLVREHDRRQAWRMLIHDRDLQRACLFALRRHANGECQVASHEHPVSAGAAR